MMNYFVRKHEVPHIVSIGFLINKQSFRLVCSGLQFIITHDFHITINTEYST